jgi:hypothetical protein
MKASVYIETTITGYLTAWQSRDIVFAARQQITREWWNTRRSLFTLEAGDGDPVAARERIDVLSGVRMLTIADVAEGLAAHLLAKGALPAKAAADALHVAIAATNTIDYLLTWNCRHLANAAMRDTINQACIDRGFRSPVICTPEELIGV